LLGLIHLLGLLVGVGLPSRARTVYQLELCYIQLKDILGRILVERSKLESGQYRLLTSQLTDLFQCDLSSLPRRSELMMAVICIVYR
jgi:hypothetical protein